MADILFCYINGKSNQKPIVANKASIKPDQGHQTCKIVYEIDRSNKRHSGSCILDFDLT